MKANQSHKKKTKFPGHVIIRQHLENLVIPKTKQKEREAERKTSSGLRKEQYFN